MGIVGNEKCIGRVPDKSAKNVNGCNIGMVKSEMGGIRLI